MSKRKKAPPAPPNPLEDALQRLAPLLAADELARLQAELEKPVPLSLRVNPIKAGDPQTAVKKWAAQYGWQVKPVPFCPAGWWVTDFNQPPSQTLEHRLGHFYIQDAASMLPVELFDFDGLDNPLILDLAASPGGKTTHLVSRAGDRGLTLANDSSQERIQALRIVLQNWGALSSVVTHFPGEKFGAWYPETFDRVLLDAPCSMQGLRSSEAHPMRPITEREQAALAKRQARLLQSALQAVKVGGQVVYSTCTLAPEEDEAVLNALMMLYPGQIQVDDLSARLPAPAPALTEYNGIPNHPSIANAARLWPHIYSTAGFFAARLTKLEPLEGEPEPPPYRPLERVGYAPVPNRERHALALELERLYQFNLLEWMEAHALHLWQREFVYYAFPIAFLEQFSTLPVQAAGIILGERAPDGMFNPAHEWASRAAGQLAAGRVNLAAEQTAAWLRGEDLPGKPACDLPIGAVALVFDEQARFTGRGKVLSNRLKNLLPRRML
jgi:16S rRNA (cytosine1407-C5)-methyltransferase